MIQFSNSIHQKEKGVFYSRAAASLRLLFVGFVGKGTFGYLYFRWICWEGDVWLFLLHFCWEGEVWLLFLHFLAFVLEKGTFGHLHCLC